MNNKDLTEAIIENNKEVLCEMFIELSELVLDKCNFTIWTDRDDMIQEGVLICFEKAKKFDPGKGKAFNYFTTCLLGHFRQITATRNRND